MQLDAIEDALQPVLELLDLADVDLGDRLHVGVAVGRERREVAAVLRRDEHS